MVKWDTGGIIGEEPYYKSREGEEGSETKNKVTQERILEALVDYNRELMFVICELGNDGTYHLRYRQD